MTDIEAVAIGSGMKLTCSRDELSQKLAVVARAVSARTTVLVLGGVLLRAENGEVQLAAAHVQRRGLPAAARRRIHRDVHRRPRGPARHGRARFAFRVA